MNEVVNFLNENPVLYLATIGRDGKPKVRPFQFMLEKEGKLFFCTSNKKEVYEEIKLNPYVEFSTTNQNNVWIRISGRVKFSDDMAAKTKILEQNPLIKSIYKTPDNPIFEIFYLENVKAVIADFSGQPPKQYNL
ncbi:pyridoxamine 5'-phosphate oxidase-related FMN-binding protein [Desulfotomaculum nigrificans CO-1-SRB]|uniref:Pyridoxamine 5'-phosphate oxidase-related FMN-binding protein n=1 Tax=Desulfotomaculum nigrificans (strain DSM 14880 / VKM B-2319 / CO-1-SRB) TaxID=868595 RepID=F6B6D5_DESCC|nr:pyridoxamine 5'-phosphate oxidase family protein [Desulfotomaculum nigrificans]AEF93206.1 pyridoxamine 5'-phosphate oxidase-related FMN-binding protein [Desulfotomaculum nigrificans CO-1-SRB]